MRTWIPLTTALFCCLALDLYSFEKLAFEVASIKPSKPSPMGRMMMGMNSDAGMARFTNLPLREYIRVAYRVKDFQIQGPDWLASDRFDVTAKLPAGSSKDQIPEMLQTLLADRFKLTLHRETKVHAIYALLVAKGGPKLKPAEIKTGEDGPVAPKPDNSGLPHGRMMMQMTPAGAHLRAPATTLGDLADLMSRFAERPVVDMTGIKGQYSFDLTFTPETMHGLPMPPKGAMPPGGGTMPPGGGPIAPGGEDHPPSDMSTEEGGSLADAVKPYGLKLEPRKAPVEILIVDHIERTPTED